MNLVRAISLGGGGRDLRGDGNDSTGLICHVQLFILAIDCIFNIIVDNFLRDPLVVLIIFICQVFLLIIGLIFYLMTSVNQAMKEGIHDAILRHHQVTIVLWTLYFSMLIWWYVWVLKRSWPSAGDHFSFAFSGSNEDNIKDGSSKLPQITTEMPTFTNVTVALDNNTRKTTTPYPSTFFTTPGVDGFDNFTTIIPSTNNIANATTTFPIVPGERESTISNKTSSSPLNFQSRSYNSLQYTKNMEHALNTSAASIKTPSSEKTLIFTFIGTRGQFNSTASKNNTGQKENSDSDSFTFFWSPGFIAVYTIERSASLFFYVAYILGTLHIVNASLIEDEQGKGQANAGKSGRNHHHHQRTTDPNTKNKIKSSSYLSQHSPGYFESDSHNSYMEDNGDNFIRQLENQEADDPFENDQYIYEYKYKNNNPPASFNYGSHYHPHAEDDSSDGDIVSIKSSEAETHGKKHTKKITNKRDNKNSRRRDFNKGNVTSPPNHRPFTARFKSSKLKENIGKITKTKGGLRNMMMMAELENSTESRNIETGIFTTGEYQESSSPPLRNINHHHDANDNRKSTSVVTASTSIDSVAPTTYSGSTDELLIVSELFTRGGGGSNNNVNNNYQSRNEAFDLESYENIDNIDDYDGAEDKTEQSLKVKSYQKDSRNKKRDSGRDPKNNNS